MASQDFLTVGENQITLKMGNASIVLKADGSIDIRGVHINVEGSGRIQIKAFSDLTLKGAKILEN